MELVVLKYQQEEDIILEVAEVELLLWAVIPGSPGVAGGAGGNGATSEIYSFSVGYGGGGGRRI